MSIFYTGDWHSVGVDYYRKVELYSMGWNSPQIDIENYSVVGSSYGGPLAIIKDDKKFLKVTSSVSAKPIISIYTPAGNIISSIKWDSGVLVKMGWSSSEDLLCVQEDGNVLIYDLFGLSKETVKCFIGSESKEKAYESEIFPSSSGTGVAYLTTKGNFVVLNNYKNARVKRFPQLPDTVDSAGGSTSSSITCWAVVSSQKQTQILAAKGSLLFLVDGSQCSQVFPEFSSVAGMNAAITSIAVSLNGLHVALLTDSGVLWLGSADLQAKYCEHTAGLRTRPKQMVWCGSKAVVISWDTSLLLVSLDGNTLTFTMDSQFALVPEIDCVRVIGNFSHEIIQKVPKESNEIFGIGSVAPGSVLLEASKKFNEGSHKADEYIRMITDIRTAVEQCIVAAGHEFYPPTQKMLLKAAQFGKCFLTKYSPENYVHMCQMLRILNAVKDYKVAIPLTYTQLDMLGIQVLIDRLVLRRQYALAIKIAEFLKLRETQGRSRILAHWACYKVGQTHVEESRLAAEIYSKLKSDTNISYSEIANKAFDAGRKRLALNLAQFEVRRSVQVPLFLKLGDRNTALRNAVESGDANIIYDVLLNLKSTMPLSEFQMLIRKYPMAQNLYIKFCQTFNPDAVRDIYEQEDDFQAQGALFIKESYKETNPTTRLSVLVSAQEMYKKGKNDFMANLCEEQHKLLKYQLQWDEQFDREFRDLSLRDTIKNLLSLKQTKLAEKLKSEFKVSDKMYWSIRLQTHAEQGEWMEIEKMAKSKKTPGGFEEFVEICLQFGNRAEAHKYLSKVRDELQVKYYCMAKFYDEAAKLAFEKKNEDDLRYVRQQCLATDRATADNVAQLIEQLRTNPPDRASRRQ